MRSQKFKLFAKAVKEKTRFPAIRAILARKNGTLFSYVKEIKEIDNVLLIRLRGSIDSYTIPLLKKDKTRAPDRHLLLDFKDVVHIDSATLASLLMLLSLLKIKGRKLGIINATPLMKSYFSIAKINKLVKIYKNEQEAIKKLRTVY